MKSNHNKMETVLANRVGIQFIYKNDILNKIKLYYHNRSFAKLLRDLLAIA